jgi:hypothetical protein
MPRASACVPAPCRAREVNASLIKTARGEGNWQDCKVGAAQQDAARMFVHYEDLVGSRR